MRWLLYGSRGWIGGQLMTLLRASGDTVIEGQSRVDNRQTTLSEITRVNPHRVICTTGRTSGPGCSNIDYLEGPGKLVENLRDNLHGPLNLAQICQELEIHLTYLGTGCIFAYDQEHPIGGPGYTEEDQPNFVGSQYSMVKGVTDQLIQEYSNTLNARIRMPISADLHPRNFVTKITKYAKVISIPNSMSVLPELLPIMIDMARHGITGTVNLTNPGAISHSEILDLYREYLDHNFTYHVMDLADLPKYTVGQRSNNYLDTHLLEHMYPTVKPIKESIRAIFAQAALENAKHI